MKPETKKRRMEEADEILACRDLMEFLVSANVKPGIDPANKARITVAQAVIRSRLAGRPSKYLHVAAAYLLGEGRQMLQFHFKFFAAERKLQNAHKRLAQAVEERSASIAEYERRIAEAKDSIKKLRRKLNEHKQYQEPDRKRLLRMSILAAPPKVADDAMVVVRNPAETVSGN